MNLSVEEALELLKKNNTPKNVIEHCLAVSLCAGEIARKIKSRGHVVDIDFVESAALLHDMGRNKTHGVGHGVGGAKILGDYPGYARVCERHIGGGITADEAEKLGLDKKDYLPETLEEKIVCYADKITDGTKRITIEEAIKKFQTKLGKNHPTIERIKKIEKDIIALADR
jgi:uncharacterized protein